MTENDPNPGPDSSPDAASEPGAAHRDDGLDLARQLSRATAASPLGRKVWRRRSKSNESAQPGAAGVSGAHPDDRDPQLLSSQVERLVAERGWGLDLRLRGIFARWEELVGAEVGAHCAPESFAEGKLVVRADSTAWATQLTLLTPALLRRLNEELGEATVTIIDVVGPHTPSWIKGRRRTRDSRGPRDTYG